MERFLNNNCDINIFGYNPTTCDAPFPAYIFFTKGCNMKCPYCHNKDEMYKAPSININSIEDTIISINQNKLIKGIIVSGGEPTIQPNLINFLRNIRRGYERLLIKLDTNGTNPSIVSQIINEGLVNFIAMDIKLPFEKYEILRRNEKQLTDSNFGTLAWTTANFLQKENFPHEFRITVDPDVVTHKDLKLIRKQFPDIKIQKKIDR